MWAWELAGEGRDFLCAGGCWSLRAVPGQAQRIWLGCGGRGTGGTWDVLSLRHRLPSPLLPSLADDGKLSLEEFQLFFADGVLDDKDLEALFHTIDSDNTK